MLTKQDFDRLKKLIETVVSQKIVKLPTRAETEKGLEKVSQRIDLLPTQAEMEKKIEKVSQRIDLLPTRFEMEKKLKKIEEKITHLPNKDEFYNAMDKQTGLIMALQEDRAMVNLRLSDHEKRIKKLEKTTLAA